MTAEQKAWLRAGMALVWALDARREWLCGARRCGVSPHTNILSGLREGYRMARTDFLRLLKEAQRASRRDDWCCLNCRWFLPAATEEDDDDCTHGILCREPDCMFCQYFERKRNAK